MTNKLETWICPVGIEVAGKVQRLLLATFTVFKLTALIETDIATLMISHFLLYIFVS